MFHPLPDKIRAGDNTEIPALASREIRQRKAVQLLQMSQIEKRP